MNFETPQVSPVALSPSGAVLAVCNTPDARLELFTVDDAGLHPRGSVPVGIDPVSCRFRTESEVWVVNHISDSISVVDVERGVVRALLQTADEPADVVFAGDGNRAFVSCSQANLVQVFDPERLDTQPIAVPIQGEEPRMMAVSPDGTTVYVAVFFSGNRTTIVGGGGAQRGGVNFPPVAVSEPDSPHGGMNPPYNRPGTFEPPMNPELEMPPGVGMIVRQHDDGHWTDDTGADWTDFVSGPSASKSGRPEGWTLADHDVAVIDAQTLDTGYIASMMNLCMALAVNPATGTVAVVGTDAINEVRFEPLLNGIFARVMMAVAPGAAGAQPQVRDLNEAHLGGYESPSAPREQRELSIGDPRGIAWRADGSLAYITGRGSNNLIAVDPAGQRHATIGVGQGPTGVVLDESRGRAYVLNHFENSVSLVDLESGTELDRQTLHDPTPEAIRLGRPHLYDTHRTSGLGHLACATCHVDARTDRLAWDLGDPSGSMRGVEGRNYAANLPPASGAPRVPYHPVKGPMLTQTLQDIIGHEPFHWRGDRDGIEEFNATYLNLHGAENALTAEEMQQLEDFLDTITFPPNPFRDLDNSLPEHLELPGHYYPGLSGPAGAPLPPGNARRGLDLFTSHDRLIANGVLACVTCHNLPTGHGTHLTWNGEEMVPLPPGPNGENTLMVLTVSGEVTNKVPQFRNLYERVGMDMIHTGSRSGFGFNYDGSVDSIERFIAFGFGVGDPQDLADLVALLLSWAGSEFPVEPAGGWRENWGVDSQDSHAAFGKQFSLRDSGVQGAEMLDTLVGRAQASPRLELAVHGPREDVMRGWLYAGDGVFQADRDGETATAAELLALAGEDTGLIVTVLPAGTGTRIALDRDGDGAFNHDEYLAGSDPADPDSVPLPGDDILVTRVGEARVTLQEGDFHALSVALEGVTQPVGPRWEFRGATKSDFQGIENGHHYQGAYSLVLELRDVRLEHAGDYRCAVSHGISLFLSPEFEVEVEAGMHVAGLAGLTILSLGIGALGGRFCWRRASGLPRHAMP